MSTDTRVTWSGKLGAVEPAGTPAEPDPAGDLIAAVSAVRAGGGDVDLVVRLFRDATLWVETDSDERGHAVRSVQVQGLHWLPVFSSLPRLALFCQAGNRGDQHITYGTVTGAEILETCLPALPFGTGVVLDTASEHVLALPPVAGFVPDSLAVDAASRS